MGIIGGGLAGLVSAIGLAKAGHTITLFERKKYPFHRVCGEYISNEIRPYLKSLNCYPDELGPSQLNRLQFSAISGQDVFQPLDVGGFGVSRFRFDQWLADKAREVGVDVHEGTKISAITRQDNVFHVQDASGNKHQFRAAIGSFGKRSTLDRDLKRSFLRKKSPYVGVKMHVEVDFPDDLIALHNFPDGYCGASRVEDGIVNVCYLVSRAQLKRQGSISRLESEVLGENPHLRELLDKAKPVFEEPVVINEVTFAKKEPVWNDIIMCGDSAGMIAPLCGNGMSMAMQSAQIATRFLASHLAGDGNLRDVLKSYASAWSRLFSNRLRVGRFFQDQFFGSRTSSTLGVRLLQNKWIAKRLIGLSHGRPI